MFKSLLVLCALFFAAPYAAIADSYPEKAGAKLGNGMANAVGGILEIPKTVIVTSRSDGFLYGATVGLMSGILHTLGRTLYESWISRRFLYLPSH